MEEQTKYGRPQTNFEGWGPLVVLLAIVVFCGLLTGALGKLPRARDHRADPELFSAGRAMRSLEHILGSEGAHPAGSLAAERVRSNLAAELLRKGWQPEEHVQSIATEWATGTVHNWTVEIEGKNPEDGWIVLMAHTDSVAAGPGVSDDLAGVAVVIEAARALCAAGQPERSLLLLFSDAEEDGLCGAEAFASQDPRMGQVLCALNLEARGCRGPSIMFQTGPGSGDLLRNYARYTERPFADSLSVEAYRRMPNDTDLSMFIERRVPGMNFAFIEGKEAYHTALDDLDHISPASLQHQGEQFLAGLRAAQVADFSGASGPMPVWTAIGSRTLLIMRSSTLQIGAILLLLVIVLGVRQHAGREENREANWAGAFLSWPLWVCILLFGMIVPGQVLAWIAGKPDPGFTQAPLFWLLSAAATLALAGVVVFPLMRRVGLIAAYGASLVWQAIALSAIAFGAPGAGAWLIVVLTLGALGLIAGLLRGGFRGLRGASFWLLGPVLMVTLPLVLFLAAAYGTTTPEVPALMLLLVGMPALTSLASLSPSRCRKLSIGAGGVLLFGSILLLFMPMATDDLPRRQNIILVSEEGEPLRRKGHGEFERTWDENEFTPRFTESSRVQEADGQRVSGRLSGGGPWGSLEFHGLTHIRLGGRELDGQKTNLFALDPAGMEVSFVVGAEPAKIEATLQTPFQRLGIDGDSLREPFHLASGRGDRLICTRTVFEQGQTE